MNVCLIFSGIAKLLCKFMVTRGVNLSKIWSKNYLDDHFNQRLHITKLHNVISRKFWFSIAPFQSPSHSAQSLSYYLLQLVISGKAIPPFFSFSVECVSWYWVGGSEKKYITRSLGTGGPDVKRYHLQFGWTKCTICERFEPRSHFNSRFQSFIVRVNVVQGCLPFDRKFRKFRMEGKW